VRGRPWSELLRPLVQRAVIESSNHLVLAGPARGWPIERLKPIPAARPFPASFGSVCHVSCGDSVRSWSCHWDRLRTRDANVALTIRSSLRRKGRSLRRLDPLAGSPLKFMAIQPGTCCTERTRRTVLSRGNWSGGSFRLESSVTMRSDLVCPRRIRVAPWFERVGRSPRIGSLYVR
jgi:hypothetical protein